MADTIPSIENTLKTGLSATIDQIQNLTAEQKVSFNSAANTLAEKYAPKIATEVNLSANQSITDLQSTMTGPNNPLDLISGNLSTVQVKDTLSQMIDETPLGSALTNNFVDDLTGLVKNTTTAVQSATIDFNSITNKLSTAVGSLMNSSMGTALTGFTDQLFGSGSKVQQLVPTFESIFSGGSLSSALSKIDSQLSGIVASKALNQSAKFDVNTPLNNEKLTATKVGFMDPSATYPTQDYSKRVETNKLATGEIRGTVVQEKEKSRMKGAQLPNGRSWSQPNIPFKGEYPYNKVIQTESGHIIEMDDTPGSERLQVYHKSGTFIEIDANGSMVKRTKGGSYEIVDKNNYVSIRGKTNISVSGACNIYVGSDANIEVEGDTNVVCHNDITMQAGGRIDMSAVEEINMRSKIVRIEADSEMHLFCDETTDIHAKNLNTKITENITEQSSNKYLTTSKRVSVNAGDNIDMDGDNIYMNSGTSTAKTAEKADNAAIGLIEGRKTISEVIIPDPIATNYADYANTTAEDSTDKKLAEKNQQRILRSGVATRDEISEQVVPKESSTPSSSVSVIVPPADDVLNASVLPGNYQLSPHFTIDMLTIKAAVSKHTLQAQAGLKYGEIAANLQALALNVLEPIYALYPNMMITSCFRAPGSNPASQHPKGMAADIQIPGAGKDEYYDIAKKIAAVINYDQILLEYKTTGTGNPWIHVSFDRSRPRKDSATFLNDTKYAGGFVNLA